MWWTYVTEITAGATLESIARQVNVSQGTVSRWQASTPKPGTVAAFAKAYRRPVLEAFVAAGLLAPEDAGERPSQRHPITTYSGDELADEIRDRLRKGERDAQAKPSEKSSEPVLETEPATQLGRQQQPTAPGQRPAPAHKGRARSR